MGYESAIEWTDATWNPVTGCTKITRGCDNCYAERFAERFRGTPGHPYELGFDLTLRRDRLTQPLSWRRPRMIFVNSMSDLFHKDIPAEFIDSVFDTMEQAKQHVFQVLTKRSSLMRDYLRHRYGTDLAPRHIWCGVSVEDDKATARIRHLQDAPITTRFLSIEPLLGPVGDIDIQGISWIIVGGESGPGARPMKPEWALDIRNLCERANVPFFFKQWEDGRRKQAVESLMVRNIMPSLPTCMGRTIMLFEWHPNDPPPQIEEHSKAKLDVLRRYLRAYFDTLGANPVRDQFKLDLIDGFSGGGTFRAGNDIVAGTPLIMLEESEAAQQRLNRDRIKPLRFDCKFHFVDVEPDHTAHLRKVLAERGYRVDDQQIIVHNSRFEDVADAIIADVRHRQPIAGRAIFLLDQTGFSQVELALIARIFRKLPRQR